MRRMTIDFAKKISEEADERFAKVLEDYNANAKVKAIRGGTRKPRCEAEQRVLDRFKLK